MEDNNNTLDFNFWPSFSDLMLTLVLILVIVVFAVIVAFSIERGKLIGRITELEKRDEEKAKVLAEVEKRQKKLIEAIAEAYEVQLEDIYKWEDKESKANFSEIPIYLENGDYTEIQIQNEATLQRYSFSDRILFEPDRYDLKEEGKETLRVVGREIQKNLKYISEIQIQGHADPDPPAYVPSNLHLAALRAIEVYKFLQRSISIDPARHLMSATSFGEYKPVQRSTDDRPYNRQKLRLHNETRWLKAENRRIEILLFYRLEQTTP